MYKNVHFKRESNTVYIWDDVRGMYTLPYSRYAYKLDPHGEYTSIYGDKLSKVRKFKRGEEGTFESDVNEHTRTLIDVYSDTDEPSKNIVTLTFDIEVEMESGLPDTKLAENELTAIGGYDTKTKQYWVLVMDKEGQMQPKKTDKAFVLPFTSEKELALKFLDIYEKIDPDIITGWNTNYFDVPYIYNRIKRLVGEKHANRLSKIGEVSYNKNQDKYTFAGVSSLDYLHLYKKFTYSELPNYRLDTVAQMELGKGKIEYDGNLDILFSEDIDKFIEYNLVDVELVVEMDEKLQFIDLARAICHVGHVPYEDIAYSSKYLEGALLTYLRKRNLVAPNKPKKLNMELVNGRSGDNMLYVNKLDESIPNSGGIKIHKSASSKISLHYIAVDRPKNAFILSEKLTENLEPGLEVTLDFTGAYVKDPIRGKYDWVYDLDLTSLYPSIIMTLNISPESKVMKIDEFDIKKFVKKEQDEFKIGDKTISNENLHKMIDDNHLSVSSNGVIYRQDKVGCIPGILDDWFNKRVEYKDLMKKYGKAGDDAQYQFYHKRQLVQKILLNSLYGVLGLPVFRFYDVDNAEATTASGQMVIKSTADMVNRKYNTELGTDNDDHNIYIDTDSVFFSAVPLLDKRFENWQDEDDKDIAIKVDAIAGEVQDYLNEFYDHLAERVFYVDRDNHRFEIKKEYVARAGFWIKKKRYAQWIISNNGIPVDKLDVKGLDIVRSSFPKAFQGVMSDTIISILRGEEKRTISDKIMEFKNKMKELPIIDIAKNSSVKGMSKYNVPDNEKNSLFQFRKSTPAHVKAAISYNLLMEFYKVPYKYEPMKDGDKIKWVYLKRNQFGIDSIGMNGYNDPPEVVKLMEDYTDHDKLFESELLKKLQDFYDVLNWGPVLNNQQAAEQFFSF